MRTLCQLTLCKLTLCQFTLWELALILLLAGATGACARRPAPEVAPPASPKPTVSAARATSSEGAAPAASSESAPAAPAEPPPEQPNQGPAPERVDGIELAVAPPEEGATPNGQLHIPYGDAGIDLCAMELVAADGSRKPHRPPDVRAKCQERWRAQDEAAARSKAE